MNSGHVVVITLACIVAAVVLLLFSPKGEAMAMMLAVSATGVLAAGHAKNGQRVRDAAEKAEDAHQKAKAAQRRADEVFEQTSTMLRKDDR